jgi:protein-tyrosine phosphatase
MTIPSVLFVCLGNICRSPLAKAALRDEGDRAGIDVRVDSAGTGDWHVGQPPDKRAQRAAMRVGLDISGYRARHFDVADFDAFDHIVALDRMNLRDLEAIRPDGARARLSLLLDHVPGREGEDVFDPYHGDDSSFTETWEDVALGARHLLAHLTERQSVAA